MELVGNQTCKDCNDVLVVDHNWSAAKHRKRTYVCTDCSRARNGNRKKGFNRKSWLMRNYGITEAEYNDLFLEQDGHCAICSTHVSEMDRSLAVDHCHETGLVRGLLCMQCNTSLGNLGDSIELLKRAIAYLEEHHG